MVKRIEKRLVIEGQFAGNKRILEKQRAQCKYWRRQLKDGSSSDNLAKGCRKAIQDHGKQQSMSWKKEQW